MYSLLVSPAFAVQPSPPEPSSPESSHPQPPSAPPRMSYWVATRGPLPSLLLILPVMLTYELGVLWLGQTTPATRTGADAWVRHVLASLGLTLQWFPPLLLILVLLGWQMTRPRDWRFEPSILVGMVLESLLLAITLVGVSRLIDVAFSALEAQDPSVLAADASCSAGPLASLIGYLALGSMKKHSFGSLWFRFFSDSSGCCRPRKCSQTPWP